MSTRERVTAPAERITRARTRALESCKRVAEASQRLNTVLDNASNGVPIRPMDPDDSLAVSIEAAHEESVLQTNRSRRALGGVKR